MKRFFTALFSLLVCLTCMAPTTVTKPTHITIVTSGGSCPVTAGTLTLNVSTPRSSGVSPFLVFYDATATTDSNVSAGMVPFQDVTYTWNFGDGGTSGTSTWAYGSRPGVNSRNVATGGIAAHLYVTQGNDTAYVATVTATDGTDTASCTVPVTAFDPSGTNGFPGAATTCLFNSVVGSGCPAGATQTAASTFAAVNGSLANKRLLYKCGDTFTGDNTTITGVKWSVGAYGGCEGTQTSLPIFNDTAATGNYAIYVGWGQTGGGQAGDGRISDIDFEGNTTAGGAVNSQAFTNQAIAYQITLSNLKSNNNLANFSWYQSAQWGIVGTNAVNSLAHIGDFFNNLGNNPTGFAGTFPNLNYLAVLGNFVNGIGAGSSSIEAMRTASCRLCLYENNTVQNADSVGGVFKFNSANTFGSVSTWTGFYTEYIEISDNLFRGNSGGILSDIAPQNGNDDERERYIVIERNVYNSTTNQCCETLLYLTAQNATVRDNAFYMPANGGIYPVVGLTVGQRGAANLQVTQFIEVYNNICFAPNTKGSPGVIGSGQGCIYFNTQFTTAAPVNSVAENNLFYVPTTATGTAVNNTGAGNTVSNNTVTVTNNPAFTNGGGSFLLISDFKPTANFSGGVSVPVQYDCIGLLWSPTWDLGACHH